MISFLEAYRLIEDGYIEWGFKGISIAGETKEAWIFKGHVVPNGILSGQSIIVDKKVD